MNIKTNLSLLLSLCVLALGCGHHKTNKILVVFRGDSFCAGTGSSGTSSSASFKSGTQVQGSNTWGKQLQRLLDSVDKGKYVVDMAGYPGQTAEGYLHSSELKDDLERIEDGIDDYTTVIYCSEFGNNDGVMPGVDKTGYAEKVASDINAVNKLAREAAGDDKQFKVLGYPIPNRGDKYARPNTDKFRSQYNELIGKNPKVISADVILDYKKHPEIYDTYAYKTKYFNQYDADHLSGVHPSDIGYTVLARMTTEAIQKINKPSRR